LLADCPACCDDETWEPLPGWPHEASTCGQVRSIDRIDPDGRLRLGQMLPQHPDKRPGKGYVYVVLLDGKRRRRVHVAVAVLEAHRGLKPAPGYEACHLYGIRADNHLDGLYWGTKPQNRDDMLRHRAERKAAACDRYPPEMSQEARFPRWRAPRRLSQLICHSANAQGTGRSPSISNFLSHFIFLNLFVRSVRTSICTLRIRKV